MEDHRLGNLLRELPREPARPGFTARVLDRLEAPERRFHFRPVLAAAFAALMLVAVSASVLLERQAGSRETLEAAEARQILQELRAEHGRLAHELHEMSQPSRVYIGGNEDVDFVLDLGQVRRAGGATPAIYHDDTY
jgi:hypothetical protein